MRYNRSFLYSNFKRELRRNKPNEKTTTWTKHFYTTYTSHFCSIERVIDHTIFGVLYLFKCDSSIISKRSFIAKLTEKCSVVKMQPAIQQVIMFWVISYCLYSFDSMRLCSIKDKFTSYNIHWVSLQLLSWSFNQAISKQENFYEGKDYQNSHINMVVKWWSSFTSVRVGSVGL